MKKKVSIKDIAAHVGVSTALVSYVLNNKKEGRISKEVTAKIKQAAIDLNYQPNQIARSLKAQKTLTIGLIVADIANPYSSQIARIIEDEAQNNGYSVIFGSSDESASRTQDLIMLLLNRQVDGFIIAFPEYAASRVSESVASYAHERSGLLATGDEGGVFAAQVAAERAGDVVRGSDLGVVVACEPHDFAVVLEVARALATDPVQYLFVPRILAGVIVVPMLVVLANALGITGGYLVAVRLLGANPVVYVENTFRFLDLNDLWSGLIKAAVFGLLLTLIGCQQGFDTRGGAEGVGRATTAAVVLGSLAILVSDFFLTKVLF